MSNRIYILLLYQSISHGRHVVIFHFHTGVPLHFLITKHVSQYSNSDSYIKQWRGTFISQNRRAMISSKMGVPSNVFIMNCVLMGVMAVIESRDGQMDLHIALNYSRNDDKRFKNAQVATIERTGRAGWKCGLAYKWAWVKTLFGLGGSLWFASVPLPYVTQIPLPSTSFPMNYKSAIHSTFYNWSFTVKRGKLWDTSNCPLYTLWRYIPAAYVNPLKPNDPYSGRTAPLTSKRCILYIIQQIRYWMF